MNKIITYLAIYFISLSGVLAQVTSEEIMINNMEIQLSGTLTFSADKQPLLIWVHGSGNVDRNGNQAGVDIKANYIKQFRDAVNEENIAFFSFDKRTANPKNMEFMKDGILFSDFIMDVKEVINHFKDDKRFSQIILAGHSQGSLIAMGALEYADKYISISGPGEAVDQVLIKQISKQNPILGVSVKNHFKELAETGSIKEVNPMLLSIFSEPNQPFFKSWMKENPADVIKTVEIPILIINGDKDLQVMVDDAKTLHEANPKSELVIIENMNHVLKDIQKDEDNMKSYYSADYPISQKLIETVVTFINK